MDRGVLPERWLPFLLWWGAIAWLSLTPDPPVFEQPFLGWDKFQHAAAYGVLAFLGGRALVPLTVRPRTGWQCALAFAVGLGAVLEIMQAVLTERRAAEFGDLVADGLGALVVCLLASRRGMRMAGRGGR